VVHADPSRAALPTWPKGSGAAPAVQGSLTAVRAPSLCTSAWLRPHTRRSSAGERAPTRLMGDLRGSTGCGWGSRAWCISCLQELADRMADGRAFGLSAVGGAGVPVQLAARRRAVAWTGSAAGKASCSGIPCGHCSARSPADPQPVRSGRWSGLTERRLTLARLRGQRAHGRGRGQTPAPINKEPHEAHW
jgi:hypothetical protein